MKKIDFAKLALAGLVSGLGITACEKSTNTTNPAILDAKTLDAFMAACKDMGGLYTHASTVAADKCSGYSFVDGTKTVVKHSCSPEAGLDNCKSGAM